MPRIKPISGIYTIINKFDKRIYAGSSKDIYGRWGGHYNKWLEYDFKIFGYDAFEYEVIETCQMQHMRAYEQVYLDYYQPWLETGRGYNIIRKVDGNAIDRPRRKTKVMNTVCPICQVNIMHYSAKKCKQCFESSMPTKIEWPAKSDLEAMVWEFPCAQLAKKLGVSDKAIENRCRKLEISKPPRGYWRKVMVGRTGLEPATSGL